MPECLVTGANGFVGRALCQLLSERQYGVRAAIRESPADALPFPHFAVGDINSDTNWRTALTGVASIVHLAARVHVMRENASDSLQRYRETNLEGTIQLARAAADAGVRRFVFISSIKVNGEGQGRDSNPAAYTALDTPAPIDPYAQTKWEAEQALARISAETGLEIVVLRPPLVYGPSVKANFLRLMRWIDRGVPLPFGSVNNRRSLVFLGNLVDAVVMCLEHPAAAGETFLISDTETPSTADLVRRLATLLGRPARLIAIPEGLLYPVLSLVGKRAEAERLLGSLVVDNSHLREALGWKPPFTVTEGLTATVASYRTKYPTSGANKQ